MLEVLILSITQGVTEFLPISSSSHLIILSTFYEFTFSNLFLDISLHIGSFFAVIFFFRDDLIDFLNNKNIFVLILISSMPVLILGYILVFFNFTDQLRSIKIIAWSTLIFGILLYISDKFSLKKEMKKDFDFKSAILIGLLHSLSLIPGVSRSGVAITAGRFLGYKRVEAAKISFLLSIPTLFFLTLYGTYSLYEKNSLHFSQINLISIFLSFIFSYLTIKYFLKFINKFNLNIFIIYRIILGSILMFYVYK